MFREYMTIENVMDSVGRDLVKAELNSAPLYTCAVEALGYTQIGIQVLKNGKEISQYVSHNDSIGTITSIEKGFRRSDPDIVVRVEERTLMDILYDIDNLKAHPFRAFTKYCTKFRPGRFKDYTKLMFDLPRFVTRVFHSPSKPSSMPAQIDV